MATELNPGRVAFDIYSDREQQIKRLRAAAKRKGEVTVSSDKVAEDVAAFVANGGAIEKLPGPDA